MEVVCKECGVKFKARQAELNRGNAKFCSIGCGTRTRNRNRRGKYLCVQRTCSWCKQTYLVKPCRTKSRFCSRKCKDAEATITGTWAARDNALRVLPNICVHCGSTEDLILHHIDRDHFNNDVTNWRIVCRTCHVRVEHPEIILNLNANRLNKIRRRNSLSLQ
jgi:hypothetical protein